MGGYKMPRKQDVKKPNLKKYVKAKGIEVRAVMSHFTGVDISVAHGYEFIEAIDFIPRTSEPGTLDEATTHVVTELLGYIMKDTNNKVEIILKP
jgi:hypothetical protein